MDRFDGQFRRMFSVLNTGEFEVVLWRMPYNETSICGLVRCQNDLQTIQTTLLPYGLAPFNFNGIILGWLKK